VLLTPYYLYLLPSSPPYFFPFHFSVGPFVLLLPFFVVSFTLIQCLVIFSPFPAVFASSVDAIQQTTKHLLQDIHNPTAGISDFTAYKLYSSNTITKKTDT
jgi:hypothetical protein